MTISKREKQWLLFDDDTIKVISEDQVKECFGKSHHKTHKKKNNKTGRGELDVARHLDAYLLFYSEKPDIISF